MGFEANHFSSSPGWDLGALEEQQSFSACLARIDFLQDDVEEVQADMRAFAFAIRQNIKVEAQVMSQKKDIETLKLENKKLHARVDELSVLLDKVMGRFSELEYFSPPSSLSSAQKTSPKGGHRLPLRNAWKGGLRIPRGT